MHLDSPCAIPEIFPRIIITGLPFPIPSNIVSRRTLHFITEPHVLSRSLTNFQNVKCIAEINFLPSTFHLAQPNFQSQSKCWIESIRDIFCYFPKLRVQVSVDKQEVWRLHVHVKPCHDLSSTSSVEHQG